MSIIIALITNILVVAMFVYFFKKITDIAKEDGDNYFESQKRNNGR